MQQLDDFYFPFYTRDNIEIKQRPDDEAETFTKIIKIWDHSHIPRITQENIQGYKGKCQHQHAYKNVRLV